MSNHFIKYSDYYDLLNQGKDYETETKYVESLIEQFKSNNVENLLDIGCGTGLHANFLSRNGINVLGIDTSQSMLDLAQSKYKNNKNISFKKGDARSFNAEIKFDVVTSLFHVINYQITNDDVKKFFKTVSSHLKMNGLLIFDFWNKPAVVNLGPSKRTRTMEDENNIIIRTGNPKHIIDKDIVEVNFDINIQNKSTGNKFSFTEDHMMRYYDIDFLSKLMETFSLKIINAEEWLTKNQPSNKTWGVCIVAKKY